MYKMLYVILKYQGFFIYHVFKFVPLNALKDGSVFIFANKNHFKLSFDSFRKVLCSTELDITTEMKLVIAVKLDKTR